MDTVDNGTIGFGIGLMLVIGGAIYHFYFRKNKDSKSTSGGNPAGKKRKN